MKRVGKGASCWRVLMREVLVRGVLVLGVLVLMGACRSENPTVGGVVDESTVVKIGVILPREGGKYNEVMTWVQEQVVQASKGEIRPEFIWVDESKGEVRSAAMELMLRTDVACLIGCEGEENTRTVATVCHQNRKPLFTFSTAIEVIRQFGNEQFVWGLCESDVTQSEVLLALAAMQGHESVTLLAQRGHPYTQVFLDWYEFQAAELGVKSAGVVTFEQPGQLQGAVKRALQLHTQAVVAIPASKEEAVEMIRSFQQEIPRGSEGPEIYFGNKAYDAQVLKEVGAIERSLRCTGVALVPSPLSGFGVSFFARYNRKLQFGEAELFDAVMVACLAHLHRQVEQQGQTSPRGLEQAKEENEAMNRSIGALLSRTSEVQGGWTLGRMEEAFAEIQEGGTPVLSGATGSLDFAPKLHSFVQYSTYVHWRIYEQAFITLDHYSRGGGKQASSAVGSWEWEKKLLQNMDPNQPQGEYAELKGQWAVIVAASQGWSNYRHQADALALYRQLKERGWEDERILLILEDDLAYHPQNPYPGVITQLKGGENLYEGAQVDYQLSQLTLDNLAQLMRGEELVAGAGALQSGANDNVILFWSGHGSPLEGKRWYWGEKELLSGNFLRELLQQMQAEERFRRLLWVVEACYAGEVAAHAEGIPGVLMLTAANAKEQSLATDYNVERGTYLSNSFTTAFLKQLQLKPQSSMHELYTQCFYETIGSHVTLYNVGGFGNLFETGVGEFVTPF
ncbi:MAG: C13 family peptidase [Phocaeicola sp.]